MLYQLRQRSRTISALLAPVLLFAWLMTVCGACAATIPTIEKPPAAMAHCSQDTVVDHGCCDREAPCAGLACDQVADKPITLTPGEVVYAPLTKWALIPTKEWAPPSFPQLRAGIPAPMPVAYSVHTPPLYLQNCSFLI